MNSSTIISNQIYKKRLILLGLITIFFYLIVNIFFYKANEKILELAEKNIIYDGYARGKFFLMRSLFKDTRPDIVFIGNSQSINHINSSLFHKAGIKVFNYATVGYFVAQYALMIENAIKVHPKIIAISIPMIDFFSPSQYYFEHYDQQADLSLIGIKSLTKNMSSFDQFKLALLYSLRYLKNLDYFIANGDTLKRNIVKVYKKHARLMRVLTQAFTSYEPRMLSLACDFDSGGKRIPHHCENGDFVHFGTDKTANFDNFGKIKNYNDKDYNFMLVTILNNLFDRISQAGIKPVLIIIPLIEKHVINHSLLQKTIHASIIDIHKINFLVSHFHDQNHYNYDGRKKFSTALIKEMKPLLQA